MGKRSIKRKQMWKMLLAMLIFCVGISVPRSALAEGVNQKGYIIHDCAQCCELEETRYASSIVNKFVPGSEHIFVLKSYGNDNFENEDEICWDLRGCAAFHLGLGRYVTLEPDGAACKVAISPDLPAEGYDALHDCGYFETYDKVFSIFAGIGDEDIAFFSFSVTDPVYFQYYGSELKAIVNDTIQLDNQFYQASAGQSQIELITYNGDDVVWLVRMPKASYGEYTEIEDGANTFQFKELGNYMFFSKYKLGGEADEKNYSTHTIYYQVKDIEHVWSAATYTWNEDKSKCTAERVCTVCAGETGHIETAEAVVTEKVVKLADCENDGVKEYTAVFEESWAEKQYETEAIPALGHKEETIEGVPATMAENGTASGKKCSVCGELLSGCEIIYKVATIKLEQTSFTYDGKAKNPELIVKDAKNQTISSDCYTVKQSTGRKNVGAYHVVKRRIESGGNGGLFSAKLPL